jgi:hypothetical protein
VDLHQDVIVSYLWVWHFADPSAILLSITIDDERFHDFPISNRTLCPLSFLAPQFARMKRNE